MSAYVWASVMRATIDGLVLTLSNAAASFAAFPLARILGHSREQFPEHGRGRRVR